MFVLPARFNRLLTSWINSIYFINIHITRDTKMVHSFILCSFVTILFYLAINDSSL